MGESQFHNTNVLYEKFAVIFLKFNAHLFLDYYEYAEAEGSISEEYSGSGGVDYADETLELIKSLEENPTKDLMEFFNQQSKPIIDKLTENHSSNLIKYISGRLSYMYDKLFSRLN